MVFNLIVAFMITIALASTSMMSPLPLALLLIGYAIALGMFSWLFLTKWIGVSMALIYLGGMMVVFLYVAFLSINSKFTNPHFKLFLIVPPVLMTLFSGSLNCVPPQQNSMLQVYLNTNLESTIFLVVYLLLTLLVVVKLTESFKGAMIKKF